MPDLLRNRKRFWLLPAVVLAALVLALALVPALPPSLRPLTLF